MRGAALCAVVSGVVLFGCQTDVGEPGEYETETGGGTGTGSGSCEPASRWADEDQEDWEGSILPSEYQSADMQCRVEEKFLPIHAAHLHTGQILAWGGAFGDQMLYDIGSATLSWRPLFAEGIDPNQISDIPEYTSDCGATQTTPLNQVYADTFCSGHTLGPNGELYVIGGNVNGSFSGGGLVATTYFEPGESTAWNQGWIRPGSDANLQFDRWYPTMVQLADGRFLGWGGRYLPSATAFDLVEIMTPGASTWWELKGPTIGPDWAGFRIMYPFLFLLPDGNVFFAGAEAVSASDLAPDDWRNGAVFDTTFGSETWNSSVTITGSQINGGAAVLYEPWKVMKSGGGNLPPATAEKIDLTGYQGAGVNPKWESAGNMTSGGRHFHSMTLLPNGKVLVTGGNAFDNGGQEDDPTNDCFDGNDEIRFISCDNEGQPDPSLCPPPANVCNSSGTCRSDSTVTCTDPSDCPGFCVDVGLGAGSEYRCNPKNNTCYATKTAEIWNPEDDSWTELDEQIEPRMYHSTAMLLPDGRVISMGGGRTAGIDFVKNVEFFEPPYGCGARPDVVSIGNEPTDPTELPRMNYGSMFPVTLADPMTGALTLDDISRVTLLKLGSITHQNDMSQRFLCLGGPSCGDLAGMLVPTDTGFEIRGPLGPEVAPQGYYMLFLISKGGMPSIGEYVQVGSFPSFSWRCEAGSGLVAEETSCDADPGASGVCPSGNIVTRSVPLPPVDTTDGWAVVTRPGEVRDSTAPTSTDLDFVAELCEETCLIEWDGTESSATCDDGNAFEPAVFRSEDPVAAKNYIPLALRNGAGLFTGVTLSCELGGDCCTRFDEHVCPAQYDRRTRGDAYIGIGAETVFDLNTSSNLDISTNKGTFGSSLAGSAGYSLCAEADASGACAFYLASLELDADIDIDVEFTINRSTVTKTIENLQIDLAQPAFGVQKSTLESDVAFPPGAVVFSATFSVDGEAHTVLFPNLEPIYMTAARGGLTAPSVDLNLAFPIDGEPVAATLTFDLFSVQGANADPPTIAITVPDEVTCGSQATSLTATATDASGIDSIRWRIQGVRMDPQLTSVVLNGTRTLEATATDNTGAATTVTKEVSCIGV